MIKSNKFRSIVCVMFVITIMLTFTVIADAANEPRYRNTETGNKVVIIDNADLLTDEEERKLTEDQLQLMEDAKEMTRNLRQPVDPSKPKPMMKTIRFGTECRRNQHRGCRHTYVIGQYNLQIRKRVNQQNQQRCPGNVPKNLDIDIPEDPQRPDR